MECGRYLFACAGIYLTRVVRTKYSRGKLFGILDGGIHHLFALRGRDHPTRELWVEQLQFRGNPADIQLVGPLCTPLDQFGSSISLETLVCGDVLLFPNQGAYGLTMSPMFFLGHPTPKELLLQDDTYHVIRESILPDQVWA